jgi:D-alanyl-lipoteichoic acid acyltransferase DltB (MBOAT superfamily)
MATGLIKKVVLADTIGAELVVKVFAHPEQFHPAEVVLGVYGALFQFYLDFSAYSDIAIGAAACLSLTLPQNFDRPFLAQTFGEFWRRWHITLSRLLRDYLFFPLGGTRGGVLFRFRNFMTTFLLAGLWHGAGWNFILWGALHGVCSFASSEWGKLRGNRPEPPLWARILRRAWVFNLVALSMLFFRNGTVDTGNLGIQGSLNMLRSLARFEQAWSGTLSLGLALLSIAALIHFTPKEWVVRTSDRWVKLPSPLQAGILVLLTGALASLTYLESPFIYFQF